MAIARGRNDYWLAFGPINVAIHRVWLVTEMGTRPTRSPTPSTGSGAGALAQR